MVVVVALVLVWVKEKRMKDKGLINAFLVLGWLGLGAALFRSCGWGEGGWPLSSVIWLVGGIYAFYQVNKD